MSISKFIFTGHLTRDAEFEQHDNSALSILPIAVNRIWHNKEGAKQERTDFFLIKRWGAAAQHDAAYLGKGSLVYVEGRIETTHYVKDDRTVYGTDFIAETVEYLNTKPPTGAQSAADVPAGDGN
jgi:single-strand DNA-binding protein